MPEFYEISHKKCADVASGSNVTLRKISTAKYHEEFGCPGPVYRLEKNHTFRVFSELNWRCCMVKEGGTCLLSFKFLSCLKFY